MNPPPSSNQRLAKAKSIARTSIKRFGPVLFTGLAAVAEHHWLKHDDERAAPVAPTNNGDDQKDKSFRELKREVKKLRKKIKGKRKYRDDSSSDSSDTSSATSTRGRVVVEEAVNHRGNQDKRTHRQEEPGLQEREQYYRDFESWGPKPPVPGPPRQYTRTQGFPFPEPQLPQRDMPSSSHFVEHRQPRPRLRSRYGHRHGSLTNYLSRELDLSEDTVHAGQVAAVAGIIEALHVGEFRGDWLGRKGVRVGTTMAASFGASWARDSDVKKESRGRRELEGAVDVGKGLVVSRMVHGKVERVAEDEGQRKRVRRKRR